MVLALVLVLRPMVLVLVFRFEVFVLVLEHKVLLLVLQNDLVYMTVLIIVSYILFRTKMRLMGNPTLDARRSILLRSTPGGSGLMTFCIMSPTKDISICIHIS